MKSSLRQAAAMLHPKGFRFRAAVGMCALFLPVLCYAGAEGPQVGWVVDSRGEWHVNGGQDRLKKFSPLPAEGRVSISAPADGDFITVANLNGEIIRRIRCSNSACGTCVQNDACTSPITPLPKLPEEAGVISAAMEGIRELFGEHPERYSVHRSRSIARSCVTEAVLLLDADRRARLNGLLRNCEAGNYTIEFRAAEAASDAASPKQVTIFWDPAKPEELYPLGSPAGLFNVQYTRDWMSGSAWILLSPPAKFEIATASFNTFAARVDSWDDEVEPETKAAFKRAYLDYLYQQKVK
jgi:hypothetical protein